MKQKLYFKVVRVRDRKRFSAFKIDGRTVQYFYNKKTVPRKGCGPLCVFKDYMSASDFIERNCRYSSVRTVPCIISSSRKRTIWYPRGRKSWSTELWKLPNGTVLADSVQLVKVK